MKWGKQANCTGYRQVSVTLGPLGTSGPPPLKHCRFIIPPLEFLLSTTLLITACHWTRRHQVSSWLASAPHKLSLSCPASRHVGQTVVFVVSHLKCSVVFVVLDHVHEVASQCFQELSWVHLGLDLQCGTQAGRGQEQKLVLQCMSLYLQTTKCLLWTQKLWRVQTMWITHVNDLGIVINVFPVF